MAPRCGTTGLLAGAWACTTALAAAGGVQPGQAQQIPTLDVVAVTRTVDVYAIVTDGQGRPVPGLVREQFELRESGKRQQIDYFTLASDVPLSLGLLIDTSASQAATLPAERDEAKAFLRAVLSADDEAFVLSFDRDFALLQPFSGDMALLTLAIDSLHVDEPSTATATSPSAAGRARGTRLLDAVQHASSKLMSGRRGRKVLVLLTDGEDQGSVAHRKDALEAAERAGVILYAVIAADPAFYWVRGRDFRGEAALASLVGKTGGHLVRPGNGAGLAAISAEMRAQYRLGYTPSDARSDGSFRRIEVRLRGVHHRVRARRGYYATAE
jgi:VWFA-related protein